MHDDIQLSIRIPQLERIEMKLSESMALLTAALDGISTQLTKATAEINGKLSELESALADPTVDPTAVTAKVEELKTLAQGLDDIVPDAQ